MKPNKPTNKTNTPKPIRMYADVEMYLSEEFNSITCCIFSKLGLTFRNIPTPSTNIPVSCKYKTKS